jgi:hypothetical protein
MVLSSLAIAAIFAMAGGGAVPADAAKAQRKATGTPSAQKHVHPDVANAVPNFTNIEEDSPSPKKGLRANRQSGTAAKRTGKKRAK